MRDEAWYYVSSNFITRGARAREEFFRQVVAISFDEDGVVKNIERFGLEDGMVVVLNRRVTDDNIGRRFVPWPVAGQRREPDRRSVPRQLTAR